MLKWTDILMYLFVGQEGGKKDEVIRILIVMYVGVYCAERKCMELVRAALCRRSDHSTCHYFSSSSSDSLTFLPERRQLGFHTFAWAPKSQN